MQVIAMVFCLLAAGFWFHAWFKSDGCLEQLFNLWFAVMFFYMFAWGVITLAT